MDVMVAQSAGFCYGVKRAVDMARDTAHRGEPCVMLGSIIHNANVVAELEALGMRKAESWQEVLPGETVVIRSHGEKKEVFEKLEELGRPVRQRYLPQCAAYPTACGPGPGGGEDAPYHRRAPSPRRSWVWPAGRIGR